MRVLAVIALALAVPSVAGAGSLYVLEGRGWGHGVGMSQWGAEGYALHAWRYQGILAHYYPGTTLSTTKDVAVRVRLAGGLSRVRLSSRRPFRVEDARGRVRVRRRPLVLTPASRLPVTASYGVDPVSMNGDAYRGELEVLRRGGRLTVVNVLPLELYLRGVVPWEMPKGWQAEAYRAQAVAARSYAVSRLRAGRDFDLYADTNDQVYGGIRAERPETSDAVGATAGRVLTYGGSVITAYYHSSSGGRTTSSADAWGRALPYLQSVIDPFDVISPYHRWGPIPLTLPTLGRKLRVGGLEDALVVPDTSGRASSIRVVAGGRTRLLPARELVDALGLRSTAFTIRALCLRPPRAPAAHDRPFSLDGFVRGLGGVRLEQRSMTGAWRAIALVHPRRDGRFTATVRPLRTTWYRLASDVGTVSAVRVRVARA